MPIIKMVAMLIRSLAHVVSSSGGRWVGWPGQGLKVRPGHDFDGPDRSHDHCHYYDHNHHGPDHIYN